MPEKRATHLQGASHATSKTHKNKNLSLRSRKAGEAIPSIIATTSQGYVIIIQL